jgi:hypothetical protein
MVGALVLQDKQVSQAAQGPLQAGTTRRVTQGEWEPGPVVAPALPVCVFEPEPCCMGPPALSHAASLCLQPSSRSLDFCLYLHSFVRDK